MAKAVDIMAELAKLPVLHNRKPTTLRDEAATAFATIAPFRGEGVTVGSWDGKGAWERHPNGDELVYILAGETTLTILDGDESESLKLEAGMLAVVPQGLWHQLESPGGVSILTVTPPPTEHTAAEDPRKDAV